MFFISRDVLYKCIINILCMEKFSISTTQKETVKAEEEFVKESKIVDGCIVTLKDLVLFMEEEGMPEDKIDVLKKLLYVSLECGEYANLPTRISDKLKYTTIAAADMIVVNEMVEGWSLEKFKRNIAKRRYGRTMPPVVEKHTKEDKVVDSGVGISYVFSDFNVLKNDISSMIKRADNQEDISGEYFYEKKSKENIHEKNIKFNYFVLKNIADLEKELKNQTLKVVVYPEIIENYKSNENIEDNVLNIFKDKMVSNVLIIGFRLTDEVGVMQIFKGHNVNINNTPSSVTSLPIQEKILALLETGTSFLTHEKFNRDIKRDKVASQEDIEIMDKKINECLYAFVSLEKNTSGRYYRRKMGLFANKQDEKKYLERHIAHYKKFFSTKNSEPGEILFTRSGITANDFAIRSVGKIMPKKTEAYAQDGWYYENEHLVGEVFNKTINPKKARVLLFAVDSCYPDEPNKFQAEQKKLIDDLFEKALSDPENQYAIIADITANLLWGESIKIPKNVVAMKTFSLSKHQRGIKNYFYGGIAVFNSPMNFKNYDLEELCYDPAKMGIVNLPRLRKPEIKKNIEYLGRLSDSFNEGVIKGQLELEEKDKLKVYSYNYFSYVIFPYDLENWPTVDSKYGDGKCQWDFRELCEVGDSFGLDRTRVTFIPKFFTNRMGAIRFSFGLGENKEKTYELGREVAKKWKETKDILKNKK